MSAQDLFNLNVRALERGHADCWRVAFLGGQLFAGGQLHHQPEAFSKYQIVTADFRFLKRNDSGQPPSYFDSRYELYKKDMEGGWSAGKNYPVTTTINSCPRLLEAAVHAGLKHNPLYVYYHRLPRWFVRAVKEYHRRCRDGVRPGNWRTPTWKDIALQRHIDWNFFDHWGTSRRDNLLINEPYVGIDDALRRHLDRWCAPLNLAYRFAPHSFHGYSTVRVEIGRAEDLE